MKPEIKNPVLRWLAGCGLLVGIMGIVGVILWIMGWFVNLILGYYEVSYWQITVAAPFDFVLLGILAVCILTIVFIVLLGFIYGAERMGDQYFAPPI